MLALDDARRLTTPRSCVYYFLCYQKSTRRPHHQCCHQCSPIFQAISPRITPPDSMRAPYPVQGIHEAENPSCHQTDPRKPSLHPPKINYTKSPLHLFLSRSRTRIAPTPSHTSPTGFLSSSSRRRRDRTPRCPGRGGKGGGGGRSSR